MKIVCKDNFDRETKSEILVCDNIQNMLLAQLMVNALNKQGGLNSQEFYTVEDDSYELYEYEP